VKLKGGMYQAGVKASGLSFENIDVVEADAVMLVEGNKRINAKAS